MYISDMLITNRNPELEVNLVKYTDIYISIRIHEGD